MAMAKALIIVSGAVEACGEKPRHLFQIRH